MGTSKTNSLSVVLILLLLAVNVSAETTFFDNPDDAFIMGGSTTGEVIGGTTGGGCTYEWNCTNWSECLPSGTRTRNCTNIGTCSGTYQPPETEQNCTYATSPEAEKLDNVTENETEKQNETGKIGENEDADSNLIFLYLIIVLTMGLIIFYLKKNRSKPPTKDGSLKRGSAATPKRKHINHGENNLSCGRR